MGQKRAKTKAKATARKSGGKKSSKTGKAGSIGIAYGVSMPQPSTHNFEVTIELSGLEGESVTLRMPSWTPGSYKIREFGKNVSHFEAKASGGRALEHRQTAKDTWVVQLAGKDSIRVSYRVYSFELSVRTGHLDDTHGFFLPSNLLMYVEGGLELPSTLEVTPFKGWSVFCPLPRAAADGKPIFKAPSYDVLADSPVECGAHDSRRFKVDGKEHQIVIHGWGNHDIDRMVVDFTRIVKAGKQMFGSLPYDSYMFILHLLPGNRGGLEHLNSQVSAWPSMNFDTLEQYQDFLSLISHEYFHLWNVKRIRPSILGPFDYTKEQYTDALWIMEGITTYYEWLLLARAGVVTKERVFKAWEQDFNRWDDRPGNLVMPLGESSRLAWVKLYLMDENFINSGISYYLKGSLAAGALDMEIRKRTKNKRSLDDVMRRLYAEYGWPKPGFGEGDFERVASEIAGADLSEFFAYWVDSKQPVELGEWLAVAGLEVVRDSVPKPLPNGTIAMVKEVAGAGWEVRGGAGGGFPVVGAVRDGSAASRGGISAKDEIAAINGKRVSSVADVDTMLRSFDPGRKIEVAVFREGRLVSCKVTLTSAPAGKLRIQPIQKPTAQQSAVLESWIGPQPVK